MKTHTIAESETSRTGVRTLVWARTDSGKVTIAGITRNDRAPNSIQARTDSGDIAVRAR